MKLNQSSLHQNSLLIDIATGFGKFSCGEIVFLANAVFASELKS